MTSGLQAKAKQIRKFTQQNTGEDARVLRFQKTRLVIGSVVSADIRLGGSNIAPIHAIIEFDGDRGTIFDLDSDSGISVNGHKVVISELSAGDTLQIGSFSLLYQVEELSETLERIRLKTAEGNPVFWDPQEKTSALNLVSPEDVLDVFEPASGTLESLEVVWSWHETILDVLHRPLQDVLRIGPTRKNDVYAALPEGESHELFLPRAGGGELSILPGFQGVLQQNGKLINLSTKTLTKVIIGPKDFAKVKIGTSSYYLCASEAPPQLKPRKFFSRDPLFFWLTFGSAVLSLFVGGAISLLTVRPEINAEELPETVATILYKPEDFSSIRKKPAPVPEPKQELPKAEKPAPTPPPAPKKVDLDNKATSRGGPKLPTQAERQAKEGEGARAKGNEGARGARNAAKRKSQGQTLAKRPSPEAGDGRGGTLSDAPPDQGNIQALSGLTAGLGSLLGGSGEVLGAQGSKAEGFGGFDSRGKGGLGLRGAGSGGGGDQDTLGGLGKKGIGGGRVGTGAGALGNGTGIAGGQSKMVLRTGDGQEAVVMGTIDSEAIEAAIRARRDEFTLCYEREMTATNRQLSGRVGTTFVISASGRVSVAGIKSTSLKSPRVEQCVIDVLKRITFPIPSGTSSIEVAYSFKFNPVHQ